MPNDKGKKVAKGVASKGTSQSKPNSNSVSFTKVLKDKNGNVISTSKGTGVRSSIDEMFQKKGGVTKAKLKKVSVKAKRKR
jgi:hypothetical protein